MSAEVTTNSRFDDLDNVSIRTLRSWVDTLGSTYKKLTATQRTAIRQRIAEMNKAESEERMAVRGGKQKPGPKPIDITRTAASASTFQRRGFSLYSRNILRVPSAGEPLYIQLLAERANQLAAPGAEQARANNDRSRVAVPTPPLSSQASLHSSASSAEGTAESSGARALATRFQRAVTLRGRAAATAIRGAAVAAAGSIRRVARRASASSTSPSASAATSAAGLPKPVWEGQPWSDEVAKFKCAVFASPKEFQQSVATRVKCGSGADSIVFRCVSADSKEEFALAEGKFVKSEKLGGNLHGLRLQSEAAELRSDLIVQPQRLLIEPNLAAEFRLCYTMPYFGCGTLDGIIYSAAADALSFENSVIIIADVAKAVSHLKQLKIVWRDLKPSNVFIRPDSHAAIADFGFSVNIGDPVATTLGTAGYFPPECCTASRISKRYDDYALGILIVEVATRHEPFKAEKQQMLHAAIARIKEEEPHRSNAAALEKAEAAVVDDLCYLNFCGIRPLGAMQEIATAQPDGDENSPASRLAAFKALLPLIRLLTEIPWPERLSVENLLLHPLFNATDLASIEIVTRDFRSPHTVWLRVTSKNAPDDMVATETVLSLPFGDPDETRAAIAQTVSNLKLMPGVNDKLGDQLYDAIKSFAAMVELRQARADRSPDRQKGIEAKITDLLIKPRRISEKDGREMIESTRRDYEDHDRDIVESIKQCNEWQKKRNQEAADASANMPGPSGNRQSAGAEKTVSTLVVLHSPPKEEGRTGVWSEISAAIDHGEASLDPAERAQTAGRLRAPLAAGEECGISESGDPTEESLTAAKRQERDLLLEAPARSLSSRRDDDHEDPSGDKVRSVDPPAQQRQTDTSTRYSASAQNTREKTSEKQQRREGEADELEPATEHYCAAESDNAAVAGFSVSCGTVFLGPATDSTDAQPDECPLANPAVQRSGARPKEGLRANVTFQDETPQGETTGQRKGYFDSNGYFFPDKIDFWQYLQLPQCQASWPLLRHLGNSGIELTKKLQKKMEREFEAAKHQYTRRYILGLCKEGITYAEVYGLSTTPSSAVDEDSVQTKPKERVPLIAFPDYAVHSQHAAQMRRLCLKYSPAYTAPASSNAEAKRQRSHAAIDAFRSYDSPRERSQAMSSSEAMPAPADLIRESSEARSALHAIDAALLESNLNLALQSKLPNVPESEPRAATAVQQRVAISCEYNSGKIGYTSC